MSSLRFHVECGVASLSFGEEKFYSRRLRARRRQDLFAAGRDAVADLSGHLDSFLAKIDPMRLRSDPAQRADHGNRELPR